jgi:hypothetical protein
MSIDQFLRKVSNMMTKQSDPCKYGASIFFVLVSLHTNMEGPYLY